MSQVADMSSVTPDLRHQRVRLHKDRVVFRFFKDPDEDPQRNNNKGFGVLSGSTKFYPHCIHQTATELLQ